MKDKNIIIIFEKRKEIISYENIEEGTNKGIEIKWNIGIYKDINFYPKHLYTKSFINKEKAKEYYLEMKNKYEDSLKEGKGYLHNKELKEVLK